MKPACSAVPQPTASPHTPLIYQNYMKYLKQVINKREGQHLHTELRFETVNHTTVKVEVKIPFGRLKPYTTYSHLFNRANISQSQF